METMPFIERIAEQFAVLLLMLERPAVQRQIFVIALLLLLAEAIAQWVGDLRPATPSASGRDLGVVLRIRRRLRRWFRVGQQLILPIFSILGILIAIELFRRVGWQSGLLVEGLSFFWLLLIYRIGVGTLYAFQPALVARRVHSRLLFPLFAFLFLFSLARALAGIVDLGGGSLFSVSERIITLGALYRAALVFYLFLMVAWALQLALDRLLLPRLDTDPGISNTVRTITGYIILGAGLLASLSSLGLDLSSLAIIGAGLSVGIGFGLQDLVGNFVSGLLLLFEQSIRPGDVVRVGDKVGRVEKLRIRSTTVRTNENIELVVPNQSLLSAAVTTYTHSDSSVRIDINVGVSYDSDPQEVRQTLLRSAERHGLVNKQPVPVVFFEGYGDSSIDFSLAVWIDDFLNTRRVSSDLRFMIWEDLARRGIEIPYPQRDLHIRSGLHPDSPGNVEEDPQSVLEPKSVA